MILKEFSICASFASNVTVYVVSFIAISPIENKIQEICRYIWAWDV